MRLTINLATRGRPSLLIETISKTLDNISRPDTTFMVSIDLDDYEARDALADWQAVSKTSPIRAKQIEKVLIHAGFREDSLGAKYNRCLTVAPADVYLVMVDYRPFVTPGFDEKILEAARAYPDGLAIVYNDMANWSFPGMNAVTAKLVEKMGGIYPEDYPVWFIDHHLDDVAKMIDRIVYCDVKQEALQRPGTTQNLRDCNFWAGFYTRMSPEREALAARIIGCGDFMMPEYHKRVLLGRFPLVRERSRQINATVALTPDQVPDSPLHQRLRAKAVAKIQDLAA